MASITTILGTDSVSSSRIVINNNFSALNTQLGNFASVLNTTNQTLSLTGEIKGGTLRTNNGTIDTLVVSSTDITANVASIFNAKVTLQNALILNIETGITTIPTAGYLASTYILGAFSSPIVLPNAEDGQLITLIAGNGVINLNVSKLQGPTVVTIKASGSITLMYSSIISKFYVVSAINATVTYPT
jgi:hypothetical protein